MQFIQFLTVTSEYEFARIISAALLCLLAIITTCYNHKFRKMEKQNESLSQRVRELEEELASLKAHRCDAGEEAE